MAEKILAIDKEYAERFVPEVIDKIDLLKLKSKGERLDVFMFAMALGVNKGIRTPSKVKKGVIREGNINGHPDYMAYIDSVALNELRKTGQENLITDIDTVFTIAEEYANTGFAELATMISDDKKYDEDGFIYGMIETLDTIYDKIAARGGQ